MMEILKGMWEFSRPLLKIPLALLCLFLAYQFLAWLFGLDYTDYLALMVLLIPIVVVAALVGGAYARLQRWYFDRHPDLEKPEHLRKEEERRREGARRREERAAREAAILPPKPFEESRTEMQKWLESRVDHQREER